MTAQLQLEAAKLAIEQAGRIGTLGLHPIVSNRIVTSTNMKNGAYTIAAQPITPAQLSVLATGVGGNDTMGTITFVGTDICGAAITEVVTPIPGTTVYTTNMFASVTSATGAGWVINSTNDTIVIGVAGIEAPAGYYFCCLIIMAASVVASMTHVTGAVRAPFNTFTSVPVGTYPIKATKIALTSGQAMVIMAKL
jgi:hypothetical protein